MRTEKDINYEIQRKAKALALRDVDPIAMKHVWIPFVVLATGLIVSIVSVFVESQKEIIRCTKYQKKAKQTVELSTVEPP